MTTGQRAESIHEKLKRNAVVGSSPATSANVSDSTGFREQKRPKFTIPKTPSSTRAPGYDGQIRSPSTGSPLLQRRPRFSMQTAAATHSQRASPVLPKFAIPGSHRLEDDIDSADPAHTGHNPFDVSEELEEPNSATSAQAALNPGHPRFSTPTHKTPPVSATRSSAEFRASLRFHVKEVPQPLIPSADWSPHRRRTRGPPEKSKFVPGGLAEHVALWIYEDQHQKKYGK